jgi:hypothetical protein
MRKTRQLVTAAAIGIGAAAALALPASAGVQLHSESPSVAIVSLDRTAYLDADGAVVFAPVKLSCTPGSYTQLTVLVSQNVGGAIASGETTERIEPCTGKPQSIEVDVIPTQKPFKVGIAYGSAKLQVCDSVGPCKTVRDRHNVRIVRR